MWSDLTDAHGPLVLASRSPRRHELLSRLGVRFEVDPADVEEVVPDGMMPDEVAVELALQKARDVAARHGDAVVLGADTIVVRDGVILGKPIDTEDATRMFGSLCGRAHRVITGLAILQGGREWTVSEETTVHLRAATAGEVRAYVATGEPMDKAGSYGAQALGAVFIERVEGCFYNVVGLPLARLHMLLHRVGADLAPTPTDEESA